MRYIFCDDRAKICNAVEKNLPREWRLGRIIPSDKQAGLVDHADKFGAVAFFGSRVGPGSYNYFDGEIIDYGLVRSRKVFDKVHLSAQLSLKVWLMGSDGKKMFTEVLNISSKDDHSMKEYASDPTLTTKVFYQAMDDFEVKFSEMLDRRLGRKKRS